MTKEMVHADLKLFSSVRNERGFTLVYPPRLFDELPDGALSDMVGMIRESLRGGGSLRVVYDNNTNYIGFFANSYR
jgi:hypothetical protein